MPATLSAFPLTQEVDAPLSLGSVLGGFSYALDLAATNAAGHTLRSCLIGMKIGRRIGLNDQQLSDLFYALLLKDIGVSGEMAEAMQFRQEAGPEAAMFWRHGRRSMSRRRAVAAMRSLHRVDSSLNGFQKLVRSSLALKAQKWQHFHEKQRLVNERTQALGLRWTIANAINHVDARWDGRGFPKTRSKKGIPILSQVVKLAQTLEALRSIYGGPVAIETIHARCKGWFDPGMVAAATLIFHSEEKWQELHRPDLLQYVASYEPAALREPHTSAEVDRLCAVFAQIVDSRAHNSSGHSIGVAELCERMATVMELPKHEIVMLRRAAWLHDLGLLGIRTSLLDKPGVLSPSEQMEIQRTPLDTYSILSRIPGLESVASIAAAHHERLDGSGYPFGLSSESIPLSARILAVADVTEALAAARSYRPRLTAQEICKIMEELTPHGLDAACVRSLHSPLVMDLVA